MQSGDEESIQGKEGNKEEAGEENGSKEEDENLKMSKNALTTDFKKKNLAA